MDSVSGPREHFAVSFRLFISPLFMEAQRKGETKMKRTLVVMAVVLVLGSIAGGLTAFAHGNEGEAAAQNEATVLAVGNTYEVPLDANLTTGYIWVADYDDGLLELVDERYDVDSVLMGGPGRQVFVFRALAVGRAQVNFSYLRPLGE